MGIAKYEIFGTESAWRIRHDGKAESEYATKEAAFEAAIAAGDFLHRLVHPVITGRAHRFFAETKPHVHTLPPAHRAGHRAR